MSQWAVPLATLGMGVAWGRDRLVNLVLERFNLFFMVFSLPFCHQTRPWW